MTQKIIQVFPFNERTVSMKPTGERMELSSELEAHGKTLAPAKFNSWMPMLTRVSFTDREAVVEAGAMTYAQTAAALDAIKTGKPFAPAQGYVNNMSIEAFCVTSDGFLPIARRSLSLSHCPGVWNCPGGYMASGFFDLKNCADEKFTQPDSPIFNPQVVVRRRIERQDFHGVKPEQVNLAANPSSLTIGHYQSLEPSFGWVGHIKMTKAELAAYLADAVKRGEMKDEHTKVDYLAVEDLTRLIASQGRLAHEDPIKYQPTDPRDIILLDMDIGVLIGGAYKQITGDTLPESTIPVLHKGGIDVIVHDTKPGYSVEFPKKL